MTDINLSEEHELQVQAYLRFAKLKRDQHVRETISVISDFKSDKIIRGEMYSYQDLSTMFSDMEDDMRSLVDKEIQHAYHTNALLVKILLNQAQANGLELHVDTNALENEFLLRGIAHSEATALSRPASDFVRRNAQLGKLGTVATVTVKDESAIKEKQQLEGDMQAMQEKMKVLQEQLTQVMREKTGLNNQIAELKDQLGATDAQVRAAASGQSELFGKLQQDFAKLSTEAAGAAQISQQQLEDLKHQLTSYRSQLEQARNDLAKTQGELIDTESELRHAKDALDGKLQESKQFQQMRKMMQDKGSEVVALRKRLAKYEPQSVPSADTGADEY